jgi:hypothetical protein
MRSITHAVSLIRSSASGARVTVTRNAGFSILVKAQLENSGLYGGQDPTCGSAGIQVFKPTYSRRPPLVSQLLPLCESANGPFPTGDVLANSDMDGAARPDAVEMLGRGSRSAGAGTNARVMAAARPAESASAHNHGTPQRAPPTTTRTSLCVRCIARPLRRGTTPTVGADRVSGHRQSCQCSKDRQVDQCRPEGSTEQN